MFGVFNDYDHPQWSPGSVVVFREGLSQSEFHLDKALAANHMYIWSVRVREGRNISNWATYCYQIASPVPGAVFGSDPGLPFIFETPAV